jgi:hypothetical protein
MAGCERAGRLHGANRAGRGDVAGLQGSHGYPHACARAHDNGDTHADAAARDGNGDGDTYGNRHGNAGANQHGDGDGYTCTARYCNPAAYGDGDSAGDRNASAHSRRHAAR